MDQASISFDTVRSARLFEEICDQIKGQLSQGKIRPGDKLPPERDLAGQFGVSRSAVREALRALEVSGLIELRKGAKGGAFLLEESAPLTQSMEDMIDLGRVSMRDFTEARILITEVVVRLACERGKKKDFNAIERDIERLEAAVEKGDGRSDATYVTNFYDLLAAATGNQMLRFLTHGIAQLLAGLISARRPAPMHDLGERRRAILMCLRARDADKAGKLLTEHLMRVHARMEK
ncbi:MAG TPA: GntR family transcriptional regulator [Rhizomicrobium sp.]|jgi:DNA-binding FadR family transcriptional regulator